MELIDLIKKYSVGDIEKSLVINYLHENNLNTQSHPFICEYLNGYEINEDLMNDIKGFKRNSLAELAVDMELLIPEEDRETNGAFFTPKHIVDYIISTIKPSYDAKVIDISCGCGAFLLGILRYYQSAFNKPLTEVVKTNLHGVDLLDYNVRRAKILIILYGLSYNEIIDAESINVTIGNSLTRSWDTTYDVVVGNPPYVKFQDMEDATRDILANRYDTTSFGSFNLYFAFFEIGLNILKKGGMLGYITPNNYFTSLSGESLRTYFGNNKSISKIVDFNATKVFNVQTYTAITFLTKKQNEHIEYARIKHGENVQDFLDNATFTHNRYEDLQNKKWRLLCGNERELIQTIETIGESIGNLFNIAVGIATLKDEVYFIHPYKEDKKYLYCNNKYQSEFKIEKSITRSLVKISTIKVQEDLEKNQRRIIFPYTCNGGTATVIDEDTMKSKYPCCYEYLSSMKDVLAMRGKGKHVYTPFYAYGRTQGLNKVGAKVYTPTFSQFPRFIYDADEYSLFTNGYALFYKEEVPQGSLFAETDTQPISMKENADVLVKILNSGLMHFYVSKTSVSIEGGYPCYQKNFIERFTIPTLTNEDIANLRKLNDRDEIDSYLISLYQIKRPSPNLWE